MTEPGPEPKSDEELEAELAAVGADIEHAKAEADQPDIFRHPDQISNDEYFSEAEAEAAAEKQAEGEG